MYNKDLIQQRKLPCGQHAPTEKTIVTSHENYNSHPTPIRSAASTSFPPHPSTASIVVAPKILHLKGHNSI